mgnify:CR=1 FL=1
MQLYNPFWFDDSNDFFGEGFEYEGQSPSFYSCSLGGGDAKPAIFPSGVAKKYLTITKVLTVFILSGEITVETADKQIQLEPGKAVMIGSGEQIKFLGAGRFMLISHDKFDFNNLVG